MKPPSPSTIAANQAVHTALATSGEYDRSPHFRPENKAKVRQALMALVARLPATDRPRLLDLGCGTGFIIDLAQDLVADVVGVDVTPAMMAQVKPYPNVTLCRSQAECVPFDAQSFDMVSAYSFLDHLDDYRAVLREAFRVLKPGGVFYADLNPNKHFTDNLAGLNQTDAKQSKADQSSTDGLPEVVAREVQSMLNNGEYYETQFGIDAATLDAAEPVKSGSGGFDADEVMQVAAKLGFRSYEYRYDWYLGQAVMLHQRDAGVAQTVDDYLRLALPATRALYKYVRFVLTR